MRCPPPQPLPHLRAHSGVPSRGAPHANAVPRVLQEADKLRGEKWQRQRQRWAERGRRRHTAASHLDTRTASPAGRSQLGGPPPPAGAGGETAAECRLESPLGRNDRLCRFPCPAMAAGARPAAGAAVAPAAPWRQRQGRLAQHPCIAERPHVPGPQPLCMFCSGGGGGRDQREHASIVSLNRRGAGAAGTEWRRRRRRHLGGEMGRLLPAIGRLHRDRLLPRAAGAGKGAQLLASAGFIVLFSLRPGRCRDQVQGRRRLRWRACTRPCASAARRHAALQPAATGVQGPRSGGAVPK